MPVGGWLFQRLNLQYLSDSSDHPSSTSGSESRDAVDKKNLRESTPFHLEHEVAPTGPGRKRVAKSPVVFTYGYDSPSQTVQNYIFGHLRRAILESSARLLGPRKFFPGNIQRFMSVMSALLELYFPLSVKPTTIINLRGCTQSV